MKKTLIIACLFLSAQQINAQSLTFKDLLSMMKMPDVEQFLSSKGFEKTGVKGTVEFFTKKPNTQETEKVNFDTKYKSPSYISYDITFMEAMVEEIGKSYHLMIKDVNNNSSFYQYNNGKINIICDLKTNASFGHVSIAPQGAK